MKIIYIESLQEKPISLYIKPDTAIHNKELPLYLPDFTAEVRANIVIMVKITKQGKCISAMLAYASQYFTFRTGDLLALPLTTISYLLEKETSLEGKLQEKELFSVMIK